MTTPHEEFVREARSRIRELDDGLVAVERGDEGRVDELFRLAHTLKGNCGAAGHESAATAAHGLEEFLDAVRGDEVEPTPAVVDAALDVLDRLDDAVEEVAASGAVETDPGPAVERLEAAIRAAPAPEPSTTGETAADDGSGAEPVDGSGGDGPAGEPVDVDDLEVPDPSGEDLSPDEALERASAFDDLEALTEGLDEAEEFAGLEGAGSFDEVLEGDGSDEGTSEAGSGVTAADPGPVAGDHEVGPADGDPADAEAGDRPDPGFDPADEFQRLREDVTRSDPETLQSELEEVEFGDLDDEDTMEIQELVQVDPEAAAGEHPGDDGDGDGAAGSASHGDEPSGIAPAVDEPAVDDQAVDGPAGGEPAADDPAGDVTPGHAGQPTDRGPGSEAPESERGGSPDSGSERGDTEERPDDGSVVEAISSLPAAGETDAAGSGNADEASAPDGVGAAPTDRDDGTPADRDDGTPADRDEGPASATDAATDEDPAGPTTGEVGVAELIDTEFEAVSVESTEEAGTSTAPSDATGAGDTEDRRGPTADLGPETDEPASPTDDREHGGDDVEGETGDAGSGPDEEDPDRPEREPASGAAPGDSETTPTEPFPDVDGDGPPEDWEPVDGVPGESDREPPGDPAEAGSPPADPRREDPSEPGEERSLPEGREGSVPRDGEGSAPGASADRPGEAGTDPGIALPDTEGPEFQRDEATDAFVETFGDEFGTDPGEAREREVDAATTIEAALGETPEDGPGSDAAGSVTIDASTADALLTGIERLITVQSGLENAFDGGDPAVQEGLVELREITAELEEAVTEARLVPLEEGIRGLRRTARDAARETDKRVEFDVSGTEVRLDRAVVDGIRDPLVHLVRNAVDHGIEPPEDREAAGKDPTGTVAVTAERIRDEVVVEVTDDGRGIDPDEVRRRAVEEGIVDEDAATDLADEEAYGLLFRSGFSTAEEVTDVSGRGVGMDVVDRVATELDGAVEVESDPGEGTTVRLVLPVTVAVEEVLFVSVDDRQFAIPAGAIDRVEPVDPARVDGEEYLFGRPAGGERTAHVETDGGRPDDRGPTEDGEPVPDPERYPLVDLGEALGLGAPRESRDVVVRIRDDVRRIALGVDSVGEWRKVVVSPYEELLGDVPGLAGATVVGDGTVVNVINLETLEP